MLKVTPEDVRKLNLPPEHVNRTPSGETFVKQSLQKVAAFSWIDYPQVPQILLNIFFRKYSQLFNSGNTAVYIQFFFFFQGILPEILEELLTARKRAKADLKVTKHLILIKLVQCAYLYTAFTYYYCNW